jgi:(heptosyl)LPS beta-1,4-glucosyltransferase
MSKAARQRISVLIPCKNERLNIADCIESVRGIADEIIVADSGSTDGTLDFVRELGGCRIIEREYIDPVSFKNWAMPQCAHPWVLAIDADERVTPELADEIRQVLSSAPRCDGYFIHRRNFFFGHEVKHCGWERDKILGLYRRAVCHYAAGHVHERLDVGTDRIGYLRGKYLHFPYWTFDQYLEKFGRYTTWSAQELLERGHRPTWTMLTLRPAFSFFKHFILRRGFLDGRMGLIISLLASYYVFMKYAKLWGYLYGKRRELDGTSIAPRAREWHEAAQLEAEIT